MDASETRGFSAMTWGLARLLSAFSPEALFFLVTMEISSLFLAFKNIPHSAYGLDIVDTVALVYLAS